MFYYLPSALYVGFSAGFELMQEHKSDTRGSSFTLSRYAVRQGETSGKYRILCQHEQTLAFCQRSWLYLVYMQTIRQFKSN